MPPVVLMSAHYASWASFLHAFPVQCGSESLVKHNDAVYRSARQLVHRKSAPSNHNRKKSRASRDKASRKMVSQAPSTKQNRSLHPALSAVAVMPPTRVFLIFVCECASSRTPPPRLRRSRLASKVFFRDSQPGDLGTYLYILVTIGPSGHHLV